MTRDHFLANTLWTPRSAAERMYRRTSIFRARQRAERLRATIACLAGTFAFIGVCCAMLATGH